MVLPPPSAAASVLKVAGWCSVCVWRERRRKCACLFVVCLRESHEDSSTTLHRARTIIHSWQKTEKQQRQQWKRVDWALAKQRINDGRRNFFRAPAFSPLTYLMNNTYMREAVPFLERTLFCCAMLWFHLSLTHADCPLNLIILISFLPPRLPTRRKLSLHALSHSTMCVCVCVWDVCVVLCCVRARWTHKRKSRHILLASGKPTRESQNTLCRRCCRYCHCSCCCCL